MIRSTELIERLRRERPDTLAEIARILWNGGDEAALGEAAQALADTLARAGDALEQAAAHAAAQRVAEKTASASLPSTRRAGMP